MTEQKQSAELNAAIEALLEQMAKRTDAEQQLTAKQRRLIEALRAQAVARDADDNKGEG